MVSGDISKSTFKAARNSLQKIKKYWCEFSADQITKEKWSEFQIKYDSESGGVQFNLNKYMTVFVKFLFSKGSISKKPEIKNIFSRRERDLRRKAKNWLYTKDQVDSLMAACQDDKERFAIHLGSRLAFRISDCVQLSWERIKLDGKVAYIEFNGSQDKSGAIAKCPLPSDMVEILLRIPKVSLWVFPQSRNINQNIKTQQLPFNAIKKRAGIDKGGFHDLRRYRLSLDFKNAALTPALTCKLRRISMAVAMENYIKTNDDDLERMLKESK